MVRRWCRHPSAGGLALRWRARGRWRDAPGRAESGSGRCRPVRSPDPRRACHGRHRKSLDSCRHRDPAGTDRRDWRAGRRARGARHRRRRLAGRAGLHRSPLPRRRGAGPRRSSAGQPMLAQGVTTVVNQPRRRRGGRHGGPARRARAKRARGQRGAAGRPRQRPAAVLEMADRRPNLRRARPHARARARGDGDGRVWSLQRPVLRAGELRGHRGGDRARRDRERVRRRLREPHPGRERLLGRRRRGGAGGHRDRGGSRTPGHRDAHEGAGPRQLGPVVASTMQMEAARARGVEVSPTSTLTRHRPPA